MKKIIGFVLIVVMSMVFIAGCNKRDEFELCPELDLRIRQDFAVLWYGLHWSGWRPAADDKQVFFSYGWFGEGIVVDMNVNMTGSFFTEVVAGEIFFNSGEMKLARILLWVDGRFYTLTDAYKEGLLNQQDLAAISYKLHGYIYARGEILAENEGRN